jgi:hypothetical protein
LVKLRAKDEGELVRQIAIELGCAFDPLSMAALRLGAAAVWKTASVGEHEIAR